MSRYLPPRSYDSPEIRAILEEWERRRPAWEAEQRRLEALEEARLEPIRAAAKERRARKKAWTAGVAKIMAEVRRRENERAISEFGL